MIFNVIENLSFETSNSVFTRAQALIWAANGLSILNVFEKSTGKILSDIIEKAPCEKSILVNFTGIDRLDDHSLDDVYEALGSNTKQLIIFNGEHLLDEFTKLKKDKHIDSNHDSTNKIIIIGRNDRVDYESLVDERKKVIERYINSTLSKTFNKFVELPEYQRLSSTPFLANGEFNSKMIIEDPKMFMWISFYMSDKLQEIIQSQKLSNIKLISVSLRGSPFASILAILNDLEFATIDHIGPKHKVYDNKNLNLEERSFNYIYIGDFVFGGTEIKITKTYVSLYNSTLDFALVLGSLFDPNVFTDFKLFHLNTLKDINNDAKFRLF